MRLPRRVPWAHIGELEQLFSWIYADEEDLEAKTLAINRLTAWRAMTALPHALDSALAILAARMLDVSCRNAQSTKIVLSVRQAYAAAIIRMVNGLVDPLQSGAYARSIASIAAQLGLPSWLVELRHAATHEELPSIELLRDASRESLSWLLHHYFHPTLNPSAPSSTPVSLRPVAPLLKSYKQLMKIVTRDASLRKQHQGGVDAVMRDIERWIAEAKVSADLAVNTLGWGIEDSSMAGQFDLKEKWALEILCDALLERGAVIPMSKRKCRAPMDPFLPTTASIALWSPLLVQLQAMHVTFPSTFVSRIIASLLDDLSAPNTDLDTIELDSNIILRDTLCSEYLARWATWAVRTWSDESAHEAELRKEIVLQIAPVCGPGQNEVAQKAKALFQLLQAISAESKVLEESVELLNSAVAIIPAKWKPHDLTEMEERLRTLMTYDLESAGSTQNGSFPLGNPFSAQEACPAAGWRLLDARSQWIPCPIGVYISNGSM